MHKDVDAEIALYWPTGRENPYEGGDAWFWTFAQLIRIGGKLEGPGGYLDEDKVADAMARRSANVPEAVRLTSGEVVHVYGKSFHALSWLDKLDASHRYAAQAQILALEEDNAEALAVVRQYPLIRSLATRLWAWILTTGKGDHRAALPFDETEEGVEPPEWTERLTAEDLTLLAQAHVKVNHHDLAIIARAFPQDPRESQLPLAGFLNTYAEGSRRPSDVFRLYSLGEVYASSVSQAEASREAREAAKADAEKKVPAAPRVPVAGNA